MITVSVVAIQEVPERKLRREIAGRVSGTAYGLPIDVAGAYCADQRRCTVLVAHDSPGAFMPSDLVLKTMNTVHRVMLKLTGNRVGASFGGMPSLELTTVGRKSGNPRSVMLTSPLQEGETYVVVASRGGDDIHPAWFLNLRDNPAVQVRVVGQPVRTMQARVATAEERARMWPIIADKYKNYAGYQKRTEREIPLVLLNR